ncbi:hypothetical protein J8F10_30445 [Gemmata sp. G18]|uniref:Uncharacterized protein n=1 Tax=Gemmata palustris TaxID=2822762 RepID=A0ABS5C0T2_9BACT|nr:hypothetical protein [Gemmata palustris]MBP3959586.1 hypothetical protein [Gemmata palustris]
MTSRPSGPIVLAAVRELMSETGAPDVPVIAPFRVTGVTIHLRTFTAERLAALLMFRRNNPHDPVQYFCRLIAASVVDAAGTEMFSPTEAADLEPAVATSILTEVIKRNRMDQCSSGRQSDAG